MPWYMLTLFFTLFLTFCIDMSESCSCQRSHPQEKFCKADFVILARIKRQTVYKDDKIYKARIRKIYKKSDKAEVALKSGRLLTPNGDSLCESTLTPGKMYVLSGRVEHLKAKINLCDIAYPWSGLSKRQRKGLKMMYKHGCKCKMPICHNCAVQTDGCRIKSSFIDCYEKEGICLPSPSNVCRWSKSASLTKCLRKKPTH